MRECRVQIHVCLFTATYACYSSPLPKIGERTHVTRSRHTSVAQRVVRWLVVESIGLAVDATLVKPMVDTFYVSNYCDCPARFFSFDELSRPIPTGETNQIRLD